MGLVAASILFWLAAWWANARIAASSLARRPLGRFAVPAIFGITVLVVWEGLVRGLGVPGVILPPPSAIAQRLAASTGVLWSDFVQTFIKGTLSGYALGCTAAFLTAIAIDRSPFLTRGLLPVGSFVAALPIVGIAPIMVMWFFPMLVNTVAGLKAADPMQRDLMRTWNASYWQTLVKLRLPAAMPFVFNGLKISTTLALIGAIVAEFFGSPIRGMGFRISTEVGRLGLDMVWAMIVVAALAGSAFYGLVAWIEGRVTFWHPSQRK
jgi:NitT/TauT family transport system permease protein